MAQVETGIRSVLSIPSVYNLVQNLLGATNARKVFVEQYLDCGEVGRLLDIGCGTAELLQWVPKVISYVGFDVSEAYIKSAQDKFNGRNALFFAKSVSEADLVDIEPFDRIIAVGVIHHLNDDEVENIFRLAAHALKSDGKFISMDPCYIPGQSFLSKALIDRDRGQNVRTCEEYGLLAERVFERVTPHHRNDLLRIPYDHLMLVCS